MNPLTKVKLINELNEREVQLGVADKVSWHSEYKDSAWIFLGGLPYELTEGDIICVFSQYGEIVNINLVRDKKTGKSKGFCFLCYEDQRSTVLAVDNFNGIKIKGRTIRVDHVSNYRAPKDSEEADDVTKELQEKGCGANTPPSSSSEGFEDDKPTRKHKKEKKEKKKRKKDKEKTDREVKAEQPSSSSLGSKTIKEKDDPAPKKHSNKNSEKVQKSECREGQKHYPHSPDVRTSSHVRAEGPEKDLKKEKAKHEHKSSSRKEAREDKSRNRDRGRSSDTHSSRRSEHSEGWSRRSRSRSHGHSERWHHRSRSRSHGHSERRSHRSRSRSRVYPERWSHRSRSRSHGHSERRSHRSRSRSRVYPERWSHRSRSRSHGHSERRRHRSRSRSQDKSRRHKKAQCSRERETSNPSDHRRH